MLSLILGAWRGRARYSVIAAALQRTAVCIHEMPQCCASSPRARSTSQRARPDYCCTSCLLQLRWCAHVFALVAKCTDGSVSHAGLHERREPWLAPPPLHHDGAVQTWCAGAANANAGLLQGAQDTSLLHTQLCKARHSKPLRINVCTGPSREPRATQKVPSHMDLAVAATRLCCRRSFLRSVLQSAPAAWHVAPADLPRGNLPRSRGKCKMQLVVLHRVTHQSHS